MSRQLTPEETEILDKCNAAIQADDWDTAFEVCRLLPLPPGLARVFTTVFGPDYLKERGFTNLMEE